MGVVCLPAQSGLPGFQRAGQVSLECPCLALFSVAVMDAVIKSYFRRKGFNSLHSLQPVIQVSQGRNSRQEPEAENRGTPFTGWLLLACSDNQAAGSPTMRWALSTSIRNQENAPTNMSVVNLVEAVLLRSPLPSHQSLI